MVVAPAKQIKKVMVVGAGPAGLEAARIAAMRGHHVTIYDKGGSIGGLTPMAAFIKSGSTDDIPPLLDWYDRQLSNLNVKIQYNKEVTPEFVKKESPDVVIVATGGKALKSPISDSKVVSTEELKDQAKGFVKLLGPDAMSALTKIFLPTGKKVIVIGSDLAALETVEFLVARGKQVSLVDSAENLGKGVGIPQIIKYPLFLQAFGIPTYMGVKQMTPTKDGLEILTKEGQKVSMECDKIMVVSQFSRNDTLYNALEGIIAERHLIGDARNEDGPVYIHGAIRDGAEAGLAV